MLKSFKRRAAAVLLAIAAVTGLTLTTTPAIAASPTVYVYCNWPQKALVGANGVGTLRVNVYSHGGTFLGSRTGSGSIRWATPWEDVKFNVDGNWSSSPSSCY